MARPERAAIPGGGARFHPEGGSDAVRDPMIPDRQGKPSLPGSWHFEVAGLLSALEVAGDGWPLAPLRWPAAANSCALGLADRATVLQHDCPAAAPLPAMVWVSRAKPSTALLVEAQGDSQPGGICALLAGPAVKPDPCRWRARRVHRRDSRRPRRFTLIEQRP